MRKIYALIIVILLTFTTSFGQLQLNEATSDSITQSFVFCMPLAEYTDSIIYLKCGDIKMEIKASEFHGQMIINIIPNEEKGPITEKRSINWYILPEKE